LRSQVLTSEKAMFRMSHMKKLSFIFFFMISVTGFCRGDWLIKTVAGTGTAGYSGDEGAATSALLNYPFGVSVDASGNIFIADCDNHRIRKVDTVGTITTVAGNGTAGYSGDTGPATSANLNYPTGVFVDGAGNIFIADYYNHCIRKVDVTGIITTVAGTGTAGYSGDTGLATSANLNYPTGVFVDGAGNIFIADYYNHCIRKVDVTGTITTVAGTGTAGYNGDDISATSANLYYPYGVCVDSSGNIFIADRENHRIRKVDTSGTITTVAGTGTAGYSGDGGSATSALLNYPFGVCVDASGNIFIADRENHRIRKVDTSGIITTVAGTGTAGYNGDDISATSANLYYPYGVCVDSSGNIFIADCSNNRIRKVFFNNAPVLSWTGESGYESDGLNPETGDTSTNFVYRVMYTDADNNPPLAGGVHIFKGTVEIENSPFTLAEVDPLDTNYVDGKLYTSTITITLSPGNDYTYYFEAYDSYSAQATGEATSPPVDAPDVSNNAPVLSWTGETGYESDGLEPETGDTATNFAYRVMYMDTDNDAPYSGYPRVVILKGGSQISGSPYTMNYVSGSYSAGAIYTLTTALSQLGTDYTYYFEAYDSNSAAATGQPTTLVYAPDVSEGGTYVSGLISVNTTWSAANSPYIVTANAAVAQGVTLTVEPGVTVKFSTGTYLQIQGCLNAQGTSSNKIVFTSRQGTPAPGDWQYIKFNDTSDDANCVIKFAEIKYADFGIYCTDASPSIGENTISNNNYGIYYNGGSSIISSNTISGNSYCGIGIFDYSSLPLVSNNVISNNGSYGVYTTALAMIYNNAISSNNTGIYSIGNHTVSKNAILNNVYGIRCLWYMTASRNTILNNDYGIYFSGGGGISITSNTISYNGKGIYVGDSTYPPSITANNIDNSTGTYNIENQAANDINATGNWWGTTDTGVIDSRIFDYYDDFNYGKVLYTPIATSEINIVSPNTAPALSWLGAGYTGYESDGINYEVGTTTTVFTYKVQYTDADGDAPASGYPKAYILKGGTTVQTLTMEYVSGTYSAGAFYSTSTKLSAAGSDYTYYFEAYDDHDGSGDIAAGPPTGSVDAPDVTVGNNSPTLTWVGTAGYEADGVNPESGDTNTSFIFKVKYTDLDNDAPMSEYPRGDLGLDGYWYMSEEDYLDTNYADGKIYKFETCLDTTRDGYFFTAYDANSNIASGEATAAKGGPAVSAPGYYSISGYVLDNSSKPIAGVKVELWADAGHTNRIMEQVSDATGFYVFNELTLYNYYQAAPASANYTFSPASLGADSLSGSLTGQNFFGTPVGANTYAISGYCYDSNSNPFGSVYVYLYYGGTTYYNTYTDNNGYFSLAGVPGGNYSLYAQSGGTNLNIGDGYTTCYSYEPLGGNKNSQNFYFGSAVFEQNDFKIYGNVFDPRTESCGIKFIAAANDNVDVKIYDAAGRLIRNFRETTGVFSWDGRDKDGIVVVNGVYYVHIKSNGIDKTHPVAIFKK